MKDKILNKDIIDMDSMNIKNDNLKLIVIISLLMTVLIRVIHYIDIDVYERFLIIPILIVIVGYIYFINKNNLVKNKKAYILLIPIGLILISNIIVGIDYSNKFLNILILPLLLCVFLFSLVNENYVFSRNTFGWIFKLFPKSIFSNLKYIKIAFNTDNQPKTNFIINIILGLILVLPVAIILIMLLSTADIYFGKMINYGLEFISSLFRIDTIISNIFIVTIMFVVIFGVFINIIKNINTTVIEKVYKKINNVVVSTILIVINAIFILFLVSEISKLTTNFLHIPIEYTYAEYAREGFFQLLLVTAINFAIIIYYLYWTEGVKDNGFIKKLLVLLVVFSIILVFNSYYRVFLYIGEYGFTVLRLQVILFLMMELILFLILFSKILNKFKWNDNILLYLLLIFYIINIYFCTDWFIGLINNLLLV